MVLLGQDAPGSPERAVGQDYLLWVCPPQPHTPQKEGKKAVPGSPCDSSGRKVNRRVIPKDPMKSKAIKTKITCRNKTVLPSFYLTAVEIGKD